MMHGRDVVILSSIDWGFLWQGPQEIATRLAAAGNRVIYVENIGTRAPRAGDFHRVADRLRHWARSAASQGMRRADDRLHVCSPVVFPPFGGRLRDAVNRRFLVPSVVRAIRRVGVRNPVIWTFLPTDPARQVIRELREPGSVAVYYCAADFPALASDRLAMEQSERMLLAECDLAFAICDELAGKCRRAGVDSHTIPYGVDLSAFPPHGPEPSEAPQPITRLGRPIVGYAGGLHRHVDFELLEQMACARPGWSWVLAGTPQAPITRLVKLPNVHLPGTVEHSRLHRYLAAFDVCIVPYRRSEFTRTVVPVKINEYLAAGKPVVSTDLPAVLEFARAHPDCVVTAPPEPAAFLAAIERALRLPPTAEAALRRRAVAAESDWSLRIERMTSLIGQVAAA
jgi:glycosyltransferase involved in cell wall biosynthesis